MLCSANQCRSPIAAALLRRLLDERGETGVEVGSAGFRAAGLPAAAEAVQAVSGRGIDLTPHRSRTVDAAMLRAADLVITMERRHVREAVLAERSCWPMTYPLKDLVRRSALVGARAPGQGLRAWCDELNRGRRPQDLVGTSSSEDVADPMGGRRADFARTADELSGLLEKFAGLAFPRGNAVG